MAEEAQIELSVILPAYNEGAAVRSAVEQYIAALPDCCSKFEIIVVNDGSTDQTKAVAEQLAQEHAAVRIINQPVNRGQVACIRRGMDEARGRVVTHNGVDLPFQPRDTGRMLELFRNGADVVVVERTNRQAYGLVRTVISWCNIALVKLLFRTPFVDHNFVQGFRQSVLHAVPVESRGVSTVTPELILKALHSGFRVESMKADYAERSAGKSSITLKKIIHTTSELFQLWGIMRRWRTSQSLANASVQRNST